MIALLAGCGVYVTLLNPLSYASAAAYRYLTASLPALVAAALVYWLLSLAVRARGRGGYFHT